MSDAVPPRTLEDVGREDAEWSRKAEAEGFNEPIEAAALTSLLVGKSAAALKEACEQLNQTTKWEFAERVWQAELSDKSADELGSKVHVVVDTLEAPHLKPSGIEERLLSGVKPACFGLFTLMQNLAGATPGSASD